jgi:hypothetical protein
MRRALLPVLLAASPAAALDLAFPAACTLGQDCYLQNLFDHDPGPEARDAACGPLAYDGHDGTDVAVPTLADQARGVDVLAAAPGTVLATRDGVADALQGRPDSPDVAGVECGNGVLLDHGDGWETQYCHMAEGSVAVAEGDTVEAGAVLGRIGYSGNAQFPHLHLTLRRNGEAIDPFAPEAAACGDLPADTLWADPIPFPEGGLTDAGFSTAVPDYADVTAGTADRATSAREPLVLFGLLFGGREGDEVRLRIEGPAGADVLDHAETLERTQALLFRAAGLRAPDGGWPPGTYEGTATLLRDGTELDILAVTTEIAAP